MCLGNFCQVPLVVGLSIVTVGGCEAFQVRYGFNERNRRPSGPPLPSRQLFRSRWRCGIEATRGFRLAIKIA